MAFNLNCLKKNMLKWEVDNNWNMAMPLYGISKDGVYLDRLQRHSYVQEGRDMENIVVNELEKLWIEKDSEDNYYQREWCEENNSFYNVQPCCVFPDNPGRTLLKDYSNNLQTAKSMARQLLSKNLLMFLVKKVKTCQKNILN